MDYLLQLQAIIGLFALVFLCSLCVWRTNKKPNKGQILEAPEPPGRLPILGHMHLLRGGPFYRVIGSMSHKYGPAFNLSIGMRRFFIVSSWEVVKECFTANDKVFATRPMSAAAKYMGFDYAMFGFAPYGPYWREVRKIASVELLSARRLEALKHIRVTEIDAFMKDLYRVGKESKQETFKAEMKKWVGDLVLNIVIRMVAGKRYFGATGACEEKERVQLIQAMGKFFHLVGVFAPSDVFPVLQWTDMLVYGRAMKRTAKELDSLGEKWLEEHRRRRRRKIRSSVETDGGDDFIDVMLSALEGSQISNFDHGTVIKATSMSIILGGTHTTTAFSTRALAFLLDNPLALEKVEDELDRYVGKNRNVDESDVKNLVYLQAIVKETLRLCAVGLFMHEATEDCTVKGYHVPAGTQLLVNVWEIQHDPRVWPNPFDFRPERFLTSHMKVDVRGQHFEYIPFGSGRRMCPGISFALQVMHLSLARLLHGFKLKAPEGIPKLVETIESLGVTHLEATPLEVLLTPRLPPKLYE